MLSVDFIRTSPGVGFQHCKWGWWFLNARENGSANCAQLLLGVGFRLGYIPASAGFPMGDLWSSEEECWLVSVKGFRTSVIV